MAAEKNYNKILEDVCEKLNNIDSIKELDLLDVKNSVEAIENLITDTQAKLNFQEIKEKLENIAFQVDSCNETILKDLYNNINQMKEKTEGIDAYLENIKNVQNLSLTSAEFEEYQKQQLDLALKTNENIYNELKQIKEKSTVVDNSENIKILDDKLTDLHKTLSTYIEQLVNKIDKDTPGLDEISGVVSDIASINQKDIKQTNNLIKVLESNFNNFKNKEFSEQISKISEIYDSLNIIHAWIEKVGFLNKSIENVYARLGANIDFDDVSEKIDIIYENLTALNEWTMKIDNVDGNLADMQSKVSSLSSCMEEIQQINTSLNNFKTKFDTTFIEDLDFEDLSNKVDIVYENLTALNDWATKIDTISGKVESVEDKITTVNKAFEEDVITSKIDLIYDNISMLNEWVYKIDNLTQKSEELDTRFLTTNDAFNNKLREITQTVSAATKIIEDIPNIHNKLEDVTQTVSDATKIIEDIPDIQNKLDELSNELRLITRSTKNETESYIYTLLDIEADFLKLHQFLDNKTEETSQNISALKDRFEEINDNLHQALDNKTEETSQNINVLKDRFEEINDDLHQVLDNRTEETSQVVNSLKDRFEELNDDISSISKRTNKLILSADDANKEFKTYLEAFKNTITDLDLQRQSLNQESNFRAIGEKLANIGKLTQNNINANKNLNTAFIYLAEWIDATGSILNSITKDLTDIKSVSVTTEIMTDFKAEIDSSLQRINKLSEDINSVRNDDISEIKSLLTGIIVQLNTALTPDIDSLNERIDKLSEENQNKFSELETLLQEKVELQAKKIISLEEKVDGLYGRIDKLTETVGESNKQDEVKDILSYLTAQVANINETLAARQATADEITKISAEQADTITAIKEVMTGQQTIAKKLSSFDENVNKIVSYIEED